MSVTFESYVEAKLPHYSRLGVAIYFPRQSVSSNANVNHPQLFRKQATVKYKRDHKKSAPSNLNHPQNPSENMWLGFEVLKQVGLVWELDFALSTLQNLSSMEW